MSIPVPERLRMVTHANAGAPAHYPFPVTLLESDAIRLRVRPERKARILRTQRLRSLND